MKKRDFKNWDINNINGLVQNYYKISVGNLDHRYTFVSWRRKEFQWSNNKTSSKVTEFHLFHLKVVVYCRNGILEQMETSHISCAFIIFIKFKIKAWNVSVMKKYIRKKSWKGIAINHSVRQPKKLCLHSVVGPFGKYWCYVDVLSPCM